MSYTAKLRVILPKPVLLKHLYYQMKSLKRGWLDKAPLRFKSADNGKSGVTQTYTCEKDEKLMCVITLNGFQKYGIDYVLTAKQGNQETVYTLPHTLGIQNPNIENQKNVMLSREYTATFTAFIGGAADKYQFLARPLWWNPPDGIGAGPTYLMSDTTDYGVMRKFLKRINTKNNIHTLKYYGYEEAYSDHTIGMSYRDKLQNLMTDVKNALKKNPKTQINFVGHSLGGWNAAGLAAELFEEGICKVNCLITIDPVGEMLSKYTSAKIYFLEPKPDVKKWINITSVSYKHRSDWIATAGNRWDEIPGTTLSAETEHIHGDPQAMFTQKLFKGNTKSASDILLEELKSVEW